MSKINRPLITEFMGDGFNLNKAHKQYLDNLELWNYVQALDKYADDLESSSQPKGMSDEDLIKSISVNRANFEHIAKTGNINGTLWVELKRILRANQVSNQVSNQVIECPICEKNWDITKHKSCECGAYIGKH